MTNYTFAITRAAGLSAAERQEILRDPGFGNYFTDHQVSITWTAAAGWHNAVVEPYGPLQIEPGASVLHYGQEIFEGLKAYRHQDGSIRTFRPLENARRLNSSARRLALPEIPAELFMAALRELVTIDRAWVPSGADQSLYIRPFMFADESFLGVRAAERVRFMIIASPAGAYFKAGVRPVSIWLSKDLARAGRGGTGGAKCGGNYASSLLPTRIAVANDCAQVLFCDSATTDTIDELGGMNLFLVRADGTLLTPRINGNILDGITRKSLIQLAKDAGYAVVERDLTISEWQNGVATGEITEAFACGTAAVITPIKELRGENNFCIDMGAGSPGPVTMQLRELLTAIQFGGAADPHQWMHELVAAP